MLFVAGGCVGVALALWLSAKPRPGWQRYYRVGVPPRWLDRLVDRDAHCADWSDLPQPLWEAEVGPRVRAAAAFLSLLPDLYSVFEPLETELLEVPPVAVTAAAVYYGRMLLADPLSPTAAFTEAVLVHHVLGALELSEVASGLAAEHRALFRHRPPVVLAGFLHRAALVLEVAPAAHPDGPLGRVTPWDPTPSADARKTQ